MSVTEPIRDAANTVTDQAAKAARTLSDGAAKASEHVGRAATAASEEVAAQVASEARVIVDETAQVRKQRAGRYLSSISKAIDAGTESLEKDGLHNTADVTRRTARLVDSAVDEIDGVDVQGATAGIEGFMRSRPLVTFGGALLLGFAGYQLLKGASAPQQIDASRNNKKRA